MADKRTLDFTLLPTIPKTLPLLIKPSWDGYPALVQLGDIYERMECCFHFLFLRDDQNGTVYDKAYFRAALYEFISISEVLNESSDPTLRKLSINNTPHPLFHFFHLLRAVSFHIKLFQHKNLETNSMVVNLASGEPVVDSDGIVQNMKGQLLIIENCDYDLLKSNNRKSYNDYDLIDVAQWVNDHQKDVGIRYLLYLTLCDYCKHIGVRLKLHQNFGTFLV